MDIAAQQSDARSAPINETVHIVWKRCSEIAVRAIQRGELPPHTSPELLLQMVVGGICVRALGLGEDEDVVALSRFLDACIQVVGTSIASTRTDTQLTVVQAVGESAS